jgi:hypothetical protein
MITLTNGVALTAPNPWPEQFAALVHSFLSGAGEAREA